MATLAKITPCLWFDSEAEEAAQLYTGIFPNSKIGAISRYGEEGKEFHGKEPGSVLTVAFEAALGTLLGLSAQRLLADYDVTAGGFMAFGLAVMLLSPWIAARLRR